MALDPTSSRGGAETIASVRLPITFATPGLVPTTYAITAWDEPAETITLAGDHTAAFAAGVGLVLTADFGSGPVSGSATVVSSAFAAGSTVVTLPPATLSDVATYLTATVAAGATVYTPAVGDILLGNDDAPVTLVSVSQAWNGSGPQLRVLTEAYRQAQSTPFVLLDATVADDSGGASLMISASPGFAVGTHWRLWRFTTADPILVSVDDGSGLDPGATQGAAEIVLLILPAA